MKYWIIISLILTTGCIDTGPQLQSTKNISESDDLESVWPNGRNSFPLTLSISHDFDNDETSAISDMADSWSDGVDDGITYFNLVTGSSITEKGSLGSYNDQILGIYKITNWDSELPTSALAVTQLFGNKSGSKISLTHADILVNYDYYTFSTDMGYGYDLQTVILHEMGHFLGLYHDYSSTSQTVMYPSINRFTISRDPLVNDIAAIKSKYPSSSGGVQALSTNSGSHAAFASAPVESTPVSMRLELYPNGRCKHVMDGVVVLEH